VWVKFTNGNKPMRIPKLQVFVITRTTTNAKDMRKELLKAVGDLPLTEPIEVPVEVGAETNKRRKKIEDEVMVKKGKRPGGGKIIEEPDEEEEKPYASFQFTVINDMLAIMFDPDSSSEGMDKAIQNYGFKISPDYWYTRVKGPVIMLRLFNTLHKKGFTIDKATSGHLKNIYAYLEKYGRHMIGMAGFASNLDITHFHREVIKPSSDPKHLKIYPMVQDGTLYMVAPRKGQTANAKAIRVPVPDIRWREGGGQSEYLLFCNSKNEGQEVLRRIKKDGIEIANEEELEKQWRAIKIGKRVKS
jgi:hypothetical protein